MRDSCSGSARGATPAATDASPAFAFHWSTASPPPAAEAVRVERLTDMVIGAIKTIARTKGSRIFSRELKAHTFLWTAESRLAAAQPLNGRVDDSGAFASPGPGSR